MRKVFVVDSDEQVASILKLKLRRIGCDVVTFGNSADALMAIPDSMPEIIISEMILPGLDGIDFMKRVKMNPETARILFVFLSSSRDVEKKILALSLGAASVFAKPIFIDDFMEGIKELWSGYESKNRQDSAENTLQGDISDISVLNILNIMLENKSSGEIEFSSSADRKGVIFCEDGSIVRVEVEGGENNDGMEELYEILSWSDGDFSVNYKEVDVERNICIPQKKIMEKAAAWFKEYSEILQSLPPLDTVVYLDFSKFVDNLNLLPDDIDSVIRQIAETGSRLSEIIDSCGGDRKLTAAYLKQLFDLSVLSIENVQNEYETPENPDGTSSKESLEKPEMNLEEIEIVEENYIFADGGRKEAEESPKHPAEKPKRKKSGNFAKVLIFIAILVAVVIFVYRRGLI
ncbi:response regulator [bacterium]|nr:response regulator [bacterium]